MSRPADPDTLKQLLEAAYRQTLARFREEVRTGLRDPAAELADYRKRRRDYASLLRLESVPEEARELAARLLETHHLAPAPDTRRRFEREAAEMLISLYDAFIGIGETGNNQGSR